jgi:hypothetical protein
VILHGGYLVSAADVRPTLELLRGGLERRAGGWERLVRLKGRLEMLRAVRDGRGRVAEEGPETRWVEGEEDEGEVEDVRYLGENGNDEEVEMEEMEMEEVEMEEVEMDDEVQDVDDEVEDVEDEVGEDDDEDDDSEVENGVDEKPKVNGVHFSDSEDSAMDLNDLIDDEASEASSVEDEDEEASSSEAASDTDSSIEEIPPPKKVRSRR